MSEQDKDSEDRQLEPTERRLQKAREEGQFPQSRDLTTLVLLLVFAVFLTVFGHFFMHQLVILVQLGLRFDSMDPWQDQLLTWAQGPLISSILWIAALLLPIWIFSALSPLAMVRLQPYLAWKFNPSRLDPIEGLGRLFSLKTLLELLKNTLKTTLILAVGVVYLVSLHNQLGGLIHQDLQQALSQSLSIVEKGFLWLLLPVILVALADLALQAYDFRKQMRMSPEEMKQELKESEGSPELRARLRQRQRQLATSRMMQALEKADVVLVNPEHYAVALRYDAAKMLAPVVVAKGTDELALKMQAVAKEFSIPVARIPPLARLMHQRLRVGEAVPAQLFEAVARVLAWAYELRDHARTPPLPELGPLPTLDELKRTSGQAGRGAASP
jgi:flagellar biosynthesis protein FlhB